jgi:hypothetical protein
MAKLWEYQAPKAIQLNPAYTFVASVAELSSVPLTVIDEFDMLYAWNITIFPEYPALKLVNAVGAVDRFRPKEPMITFWIVVNADGKVTVTDMLFVPLPCT